MRNKILLFLLTFIGISQIAAASSVRDKYNFNSEWLLYVGDIPEAKEVRFQDTDWKKVTLPRPFNEDEAFRLSIEQLTDTVMWYRKHFRLPAGSKNKKVFVEFEGVRQGADFYINGEYIGLHENGAMAVGFDLTPYIKYGQENVMAVRIDNNWNYKERLPAPNINGVTVISTPIMEVYQRMYGFMLLINFIRHFPCIVI